MQELKFFFTVSLILVAENKSLSLDRKIDHHMDHRPSYYGNGGNAAVALVLALTL